MISNPATFFTSGSNLKSFTYEGGNVLYHFSPADCGLTKYRDCNVIFYANDKEHAKEVLFRMLNFKLGCLIEYIRDELTTNDVSKAKETVTHYLTNMDKWVFTLAPTNQFYLVGWADNEIV